MIILTGNNFGERHRELNMKVAEAADKEMDFNDVKSREEASYVDKLFKIDLASRYKKIEYILEILKSGDAFPITRVLKSSWICNEEYANYINATFLTNNIFPYMSNKMQRKMLTALSLEIRDEKRTIDFYTYCKQAKLKEYAYKFLILTPVHFKLQLMKDNSDFDDDANAKFLQNFIGKSLELAEAYIELRDYCKHIIYKLKFLYSVSDKWYLKMLQSYESNDATYPSCLPRLGLRISKDILKRHKRKVLEYPVIYINRLNKDMLVKNLTVKDVQALAGKLLPCLYGYFWDLDFYHKYNFILDKISAKNMFTVIKELYILRYYDKTFEWKKEFYELEYYKLLSIKKREEWALYHIKCNGIREVENYIWYKFLSFEKAFTGIKRYIDLTHDADKRSQIINTLPETCRDQSEVATLLNYYVETHSNENKIHKESFLNKVIECHDIYSFDSDCWASLDKLFNSLEVYVSSAREDYKARSMIYHILHNNELPKVLVEYINCIDLNLISSVIKELTEERNFVVANYLINNYFNKIKSLIENINIEKEIRGNVEFAINTNKSEVDDNIRNIWNVIYCFKRDYKECPEMIVQYMNQNKSTYQYHSMFKQTFSITTEGEFVRCLKTDNQRAIDGITKIRCNAHKWNFRLCRLFRKLKVFYSHDLRKEYIKYFIQYLSNIPDNSREYRNIKMAVVGVLYLADEDFKITFMEKYFSNISEINHKNKDHVILIQKALCRLVYLSQPPVPLNIIFKFLTEDNLKYFLPIFDNYLVNLQYPNDFIKASLSSPLSIQKHGLRLAFKCYNSEILKPIILDAWKNNKDVYLRKQLYKTLFCKLTDVNCEGAKDLYEVLKLYTSQLNKDEHVDVYSLLLSDDLPDEFKGDFIETAWLTISKLADKTFNLDRRIKLIRLMEKYLHLMNRQFLRSKIIESHLNKMCCLRKFKSYTQADLDEMAQVKWNITAKYLVTFKNAEELQQSLDITRYIMNKCVRFWNNIYKHTYITRKFIDNFILLIMNMDRKFGIQSTDVVPIYRCMVNEFKKVSITEDIYLLTWELKVVITCRKIIYKEGEKVNNELYSYKVYEMLGKAVASSVKSLVEKNAFYHSFYQPMADVLKRIGDTICSFPSSSHYEFVGTVADSLSTIKMKETCILALYMLPQDLNDDWNYRNTISRMNKHDNVEVRTFLRNKYLMSDYFKRVFL